MHSTSLSMFICLFLVVREHTVFNIWNFLLLQAMVWVPPHFEQAIWYLLMGSSCLMILGQYGIFISQIKNEQFCKIGLSLCNDVGVIKDPSLHNFRLYGSYLAIMLTSVVCILIVRSKTYNDLWAACLQATLN